MHPGTIRSDRGTARFRSTVFSLVVAVSVVAACEVLGKSLVETEFGRR
jgi:hypothetical protein